MNLAEQFLNKHYLVTGGAGFIGSHLVKRLLDLGAKVTVVDNLITGSKSNVHSEAVFIDADVSLPTIAYHPPDSHFHGIFHLASPASPVGYGKHPIETYEVNSFGTHYLAEYAVDHKIPLLFTSTSECYGDPLEHPQKETYWGNVNPIGLRSCYDESKRFGEMVMTTWAREKGLDAHIVRIFNTYGPNMDPNDGRVIPNFITQALKNEPITVYGKGDQTRSFCFVSDLVEFILRDFVIPQAKGEVINIGNPEEYTMLDFAQKIKELLKSDSEIVFKDLPSDDPTQRQPDLAKAKAILGYEPQVSLDEGLKLTVDWFKQCLS